MNYRHRLIGLRLLANAFFITALAAPFSFQDPVWLRLIKASIFLFLAVTLVQRKSLVIAPVTGLFILGIIVAIFLSHWFLALLFMVGIGLLWLSLPILTSKSTFFVKQPCVDYSQDYWEMLKINGYPPTSMLAWQQPKMKYFIASNQRSALAYRVSFGVALLVGGPMGLPEMGSLCMAEFRAFCDSRGWSVGGIFWGKNSLVSSDSNCLRAVKMGESAVINTISVTRNVPKEFRNTRSRFLREGYSVEYCIPPLLPDTLAQLERISNEWLKIPGKREWKFPHGCYAKTTLDSKAVSLLRDKSGQVKAFISYEISSYYKYACLDLMRHSGNVTNGAMDFLFSETIAHMHANDCPHFDLGLAPFSGERTWTVEELFIQRVMQVSNLKNFFNGLRRYKAKFNPLWEERYMVYEGGSFAFFKFGCALLVAILVG